MKKITLIAALALSVSASVYAGYKIGTTRVSELPRDIKSPEIPLSLGSRILNPHMRTNTKLQDSEQKEGFTIYEDFEAWDGSDDSWLPDGWTTDRKVYREGSHGWKMTEPLSIADVISSKCLTYEVFDEEVDEWVLTPEFTVGTGMELCWSTMTSPYFYDWAYLDSSYRLSEYVILNDLRACISTDGGQTWDILYSHAEKLIEETRGDFFAMFDYTVRPFSLPLHDYEGEQAIIGFQIVGSDGNTTFLDNISVGLPPTHTSYSRPLSGLFFGLSDRDMNVPATIMAGPVFQPVKYTNTTPGKAQDNFLWTYTDSEEEGNIWNGTDLTVTYATDHTDEFTSRNNLYPFPVLKGSGPSTSPDEFTYPGFYQAGGKGEYEIYYTDTKDYEVIQLGLTVADPFTEGTATYADIAVPYFGYNNQSDRFWSQYTFGDDYDEDNWNHLEKYGDFFYTPDSPIVIEGIRTNAYGKISRDARFTADIYFLNAGFVISDEPAYTAVCTGKDITLIDRYSSNDFLSLNFKFDRPIVLSKDTAPYFLVAIGGFRDPEHVEYFSPEMSAESNPNNLGLGWLGHQMMWVGEPLPFSWSAVANVTDELVSFYIMLDASFPWLKALEEGDAASWSDNATITIAAGGEARIALDSYHDGTTLEFADLPEWLSARAEGRYGHTTAVFQATADAPDDAEARVTITAPGVSLTVEVKAASSGVDEIVAGEVPGSSDGLYTLDGRRIYGNPSPGIYVRISDGRSRKIVVK